MRRPFFERLMRETVKSSYDPARHASREAWQDAVTASEVRMQWDPDHSSSGAKEERRAVQLGLRGSALVAFVREELIEVINLRAFVASQRPLAHDDNSALRLPIEHVLPFATVPETTL